MAIKKTKDNVVKLETLSVKSSDVESLLKKEHHELIEEVLDIMDENEENSRKSVIPEPFFIKNDELWIHWKGEEILVCRQVPFLDKKYDNIENHDVFYDLSWMDYGIEKNKVIFSNVISTKKELLTLSEKGLGVNENNYKRMIDYFNQFLSQNKIPQDIMVNRLGHIKNGFIHPLIDSGIKIVPNTAGEQQIVDAFEIKGTIDSWKTEVLELVKPLPKALFYVVASFATPLLHEFLIDSFVVDYSGHTSQGKTTLLRLAATVWGNSKLINEWESTKVSIERRAAFLNSFPLLMDDTKKANPKQLESIIYHFSGGRSKGRGNIKGIQEDLTWRTILLSTGESSILEYTNGGGVAGRVVPINDEPFGKPSFEFMDQLYKAINNNYGAVGKEFIIRWSQLKPEDKEPLMTKFHELRSKYVQLAGSNEVLVRIATYYALIHFTALLLNELLDFDIDPKTFVGLFKTQSKENKATDKPKQLLEMILESLDSFRSSIHYGNFEPQQINALCDKKNNFYITVSYVNSFLGSEAKATKQEWLKRGYIIPYKKDGKEAGGKKIAGTTYKAIEINPDLIAELGFDFSITEE